MKVQSSFIIIIIIMYTTVNWTSTGQMSACLAVSLSFHKTRLMSQGFLFQR